MTSEIELAKSTKDREQAAFERWLYRTCPSGDVTEVHRQWLESSDYSDLEEESNDDH